MVYGGQLQTRLLQGEWVTVLGEDSSKVKGV